MVNRTVVKNSLKRNIIKKNVILSSGKSSLSYIDCRPTLLEMPIRSGYIGASFLEEYFFQPCTLICSGLGGTIWAASIACSKVRGNNILHIRDKIKKTRHQNSNRTSSKFTQWCRRCR